MAQPATGEDIPVGDGSLFTLSECLFEECCLRGGTSGLENEHWLRKNGTDKTGRVAKR